MRSSFFWLPVAALSLTAAVLAFNARSAWFDEGAAIARVADLYVAEVPGAQAISCAGRPGEGETWLVVACGLPGGPERRVYSVDRWGRPTALGDT